MIHLSPQQVLNHLQTAAVKPVLLDVREPSEYAICAIEGSINIPLGRIPEAASQLDPEQEYVLICHHGRRSQQAGGFLASRGFEKLINLTGGIEEWACKVDPEMARY